LLPEITLEASQMREHLNVCHHANVPMLVNKAHPKTRWLRTRLVLLSNCNRGNQAQLKQLCSFHSVAPHMGHPIQGN